MQFSNPNADIFTPSGSNPDAALSQTTHLCIAAHHDDIEIFAYHGIAECYRVANRSFAGVVVTDGAGSPRTGPYESMTDAEMRDVRRLEQRNAASIGQYGIQIQLGHPSSAVKDPSNSHVRQDLRAILEQAQPRVLYCHNPFDKHDTHVAVLLRTIEALLELPPEKRPQQFLGGEVWRSLDWVVDNEKVPLVTDKYESLAMTLLGVFDSQVSGGKRYDLAVTGRRVANATFSESHATDTCKSVSLAIDLTPLIARSPVPLDAFVEGYLERFRNDVKQRLARVTLR